MGRSKKQMSETEKLEKELKDLKSINKSLSRKLKNETKRTKPEGITEILVKQEFEERNTCSLCGKGNLKVIELGPRKLQVCSNTCGFRKVIK